ncbi:MAG: hypothetical protein QOH15_964, partial [Gaiellales bacterium]|nr:hypothetical protein [Gaiellales bacterium]
RMVCVAFIVVVAHGGSATSGYAILE